MKKNWDWYYRDMMAVLTYKGEDYWFFVPYNRNGHASTTKGCMEMATLVAHALNKSKL